jgi:hypothetical protein
VRCIAADCPYTTVARSQAVTERDRCILANRDRPTIDWPAAPGIRDVWRLHIELKQDTLADLDLASLRQRRAEAVEKQKQAAASVQLGQAGHFLRYWLLGGVMALVAVGLGQGLSEYTPTGMFAFSASIILWLGLWIAAFYATGAVRRLEDEAAAAARQIVQIDNKITFCHQVLDEANRARVRTYAQALIDRETR